MRAFFSLEKISFAFSITISRAIFVPDFVQQISLQAVNFGGDGGHAIGATAGGGGGGAGDYVDQYIDIEPNSFILIDLPFVLGLGWGTMSIKYRPRGATSMTTLNLLPGNDGTAAAGAVAGLGGDSGAGGEGGTLTSVETRIGTGFIGADNLAHTCGGQAGWAATFPTTKNLDYSYTRSSTGLIQRVKNKWPNALAAGYTGMGGLGGVSYFGPNGKFGAGGNGADAGISGDKGGAAMVKVEWVY